MIRNVVTALAIVAATAVATVMPARAQDQPSAQRQVGLVRTGSGTLSLDVDGADVRTVIRAIAEFSGRNIVIDHGVTGQVHISLSNVSWESALRTVLRANGLDYVEEGGIMRVDEAGKLQAESTDREAARARQMELIPLETRIIRLNYANAGELQGALQASLTRRGLIQVEKRTNSLIVSDLPNVVDRVEKMATDLDSSTPQIEITAKLVDVDAEALRGLGIEWNPGSSCWSSTARRTSSRTRGSRPSTTVRPRSSWARRSRSSSRTSPATRCRSSRRSASSSRSRRT